jgi:hypothetical protein
MSTFNDLYAPPSAFDSFGRFIPNDSKLLDWLTTNRRTGMEYLRLNQGFKDAEINMAILKGSNLVKVAKSSGLSTLNIKKLRRQGKEQIANHTTVQPRWGFRTYDKTNEEATKQASIFTKRLNAWFTDQFVDLTIEEVLNWTEGSGTGWMFLWPEKSILTNNFDIIPYALSYKDVIIGHMPKNANYQKAYWHEVRLEMSVPEAHERFPRHVNLINKDRDVPSTFARIWSKVRNSRPYRGVVDRMKHNKNETQAQSTFPVVDIFYTWVRDSSINTTGQTILMGEEDSVYSYEVPSYTNINGRTNTTGNGIFYEEMDAESGQPVKKEQQRELTPDECKFYPNRRLIISCANGIIYDGPPLFGGNLVPIAPFKFENIVGELLGVSPLNDAKELESAANMLLRSMIDSTITKKAPPISVDINAPKAMRSDGFSLAKPNQKFQFDMRMMPTPIKPLIDSSYYEIDRAAPELVKLLFQMQDYLVGTSDWQQAAMQLKQMPSQDTQESLVRALGVLATAQSRGIEKSLLMIGMIWAQFFPQVYDTKDLLNVIGVDGVSWEQFDYDPDSLIPKKEGDTRPFHVRCKEHLSKFTFYAEPNSLMEQNSLTNRLALLQIRNAGVKIAGRKIYDAFVKDKEYAENLKEYYAEQESDIKMAAKLNAEIQAAKASLENPVAAAVGNIMNGSNGNNNEGRPPTNQAPANLEQKTDENGVPRTALATS